MRHRIDCAAFFIALEVKTMIVVLKHNVPEEKRNQLINWLRNQNIDVHPSLGEYQTVLGLVGDTSRIDMSLLESLDIVDSVKRVSDPFKCCNRKFHPDDMIVQVGDVKVGGNYASSLLSGENGHKLGYSNIMYLDAAEHKYIEECGACNFFGIKEGKYITPKSSSVLPSITNKSLRQLARDMGLEVEDRLIPVEELPTFEECGGCGTAAVISPIGKIFDMQTNDIYEYGTEVGKVCMELYTRLQDIQYGRAEDKYNWCTIVE